METPEDFIGWSPKYTYTGGSIPGAVPLPGLPELKFEDRPSINPYPTHLPGLELQFKSPPRLALKLRDLEAEIFETFVVYQGYPSTIDKRRLCMAIRDYKTITEELTERIFLLPPELQEFLDEHG